MRWRYAPQGERVRLTCDREHGVGVALPPEPRLADERAEAQRRRRGPGAAAGGWGRRCPFRRPASAGLGAASRAARTPTRPGAPGSQGVFSSLLKFPSQASAVTAHLLRTQKSTRRDGQEPRGQEQPDSSLLRNPAGRARTREGPAGSRGLAVCARWPGQRFSAGTLRAAAHSFRSEQGGRHALGGWD